MTENNLEKCIYQNYNPKNTLLNLNLHNRGECSLCEYDEYNKNCGSYFPIKLYSFEVKEKS